MKVIQVYAPISAHSEEVGMKEDLSKALHNTTKGLFTKTRGVERRVGRHVERFTRGLQLVLDVSAARPQICRRRRHAIPHGRRVVIFFYHHKFVP